MPLFAQWCLLHWEPRPVVEKPLTVCGAFEVWLASCAYGSPHLKEFVLLSTFAEAAGLHRPCPKNHVHVKIEGVFTKPSAIYTDSLAESIAHAFDLALKKKLRLEKWNEPAVLGLESPLCNDLLLSGKWKEVKSWNWKSPAHINILESSAACRLFKDLALKKFAFPVGCFDSCKSSVRHGVCLTLLA